MNILFAALCTTFMCGAQTPSHEADVPLSQILQETPAPSIQIYKILSSGPLTMAVFNPPGWKPRDRRPVVVFIHGGAWTSGNATIFYPHAHYLALRGAVAVSIDYRLARSGRSGVPECLIDCKSAIRFLRTNSTEMGIDPRRIAAFGDSAGGHLAAALGACAGFDDPQDNLKISAVPNAMILCNPIVDMTEGSWIQHVLPPGAETHNQPTDLLYPTDAQVKLARSLSPLFQVKPGQPPAILMHGTMDQIVNPRQAHEFADAEKKAGNRCDLIWMEGSRHAFVIARYTAPEPVVVAAIRHADDFLISLGWLKGAPTLVASHPPAWSSNK